MERFRVIAIALFAAWEFLFRPSGAELFGSRSLAYALGYTLMPLGG